MSQNQNISVVVCVRNEEKRLRDCLATVLLNEPGEVIVVDGDSTDRTREIAEEFPGVRVIVTKKSNLTRDRQIGIDAATKDLIALIDADHRLKKEDLASLAKDLEDFQFDAVQSGLVSYQNQGFWDSAEEASWELNQNVPGRRKMMGVAPALYKKKIFEYARFDDHITSTIEDTDFAYRLSLHPDLRFGVGRTKIAQFHYSEFTTYVKKFVWYGKGDGEFCRKHPNRAPSMFFHLLIRYPLIYPVKAMMRGYFSAMPFFVLQGLTRFYGLTKTAFKSGEKKS